MSAKKPVRRHILKITIEADTLDDLRSALESIQFWTASGNLSAHCVSGGYNSGWILEYQENEGVTHDSYVASLNAYLERGKI